jgi:1,2-phenylacetyl-CoA epoxidase catalytic subunit
LTWLTFFDCREKPSKKAHQKLSKEKRFHISVRYIGQGKVAYHLLPARVQ